MSTKNRLGEPRDRGRRNTLKVLGGGAVAALTGVGESATTFAQVAPARPRLVMDGHVHIATRVHWEQIDPWKPLGAWWDYARARAAGVNCVIDCLGTYGYWNYNQAPKHTLRLMPSTPRCRVGESTPSPSGGVNRVMNLFPVGVQVGSN